MSGKQEEDMFKQASAVPTLRLRSVQTTTRAKVYPGPAEGTSSAAGNKYKILVFLGKISFFFKVDFKTLLLLTSHALYQEWYNTVSMPSHESFSREYSSNVVRKYTERVRSERERKRRIRIELAQKRNGIEMRRLEEEERKKQDEDKKRFTEIQKRHREAQVKINSGLKEVEKTLEVIRDSDPIFSDNQDSVIEWDQDSRVIALKWGKLGYTDSEHEIVRAVEALGDYYGPPHIEANGAFRARLIKKRGKFPFKLVKEDYSGMKVQAFGWLPNEIRFQIESEIETVHLSLENLLAQPKLDVVYKGILSAAHHPFHKRTVVEREHYTSGGIDHTVNYTEMGGF